MDKEKVQLIISTPTLQNHLSFGNNDVDFFFQFTCDCLII